MSLLWTQERAPGEYYGDYIAIKDGQSQEVALVPADRPDVAAQVVAIPNLIDALRVGQGEIEGMTTLEYAALLLERTSLNPGASTMASVLRNISITQQEAIAKAEEVAQ